MREAVLVVNAGSSSIKFAVYAVPAGPGQIEDPEQLLRGRIESIGREPRLSVRGAGGEIVADEALQVDADHGRLLARVLEWIDDHLSPAALVACGHRVVHGGPDFAAPVPIDEGVRERLEALVPLAPLHQPVNLAGVDAVLAMRPGLPQVACFDTAFHRGHPEVADWYALPARFHEEGVRRYGFHGLSYQYVARRLRATQPDVASGRLVVAHLGSGASMCALHAGRSIDSTMGFTALDGLVMGTRPGQLDPGVVLHLIDHYGLSTSEVAHLLYHDAGLRGVSGMSGDMRDLQASPDAGARRAVALFVHRVVRELGALAASLRGLDALVFTAGIGERSALVRERVCRAASWLGIDLDAEANREGGPRITTPSSRVAAWVVPTDEERMIAVHTLEALRIGPETEASSGPSAASATPYPSRS